MIALLFQQDCRFLKYGNFQLSSSHHKIQSHSECLLIPLMPALLLFALEMGSNIEIFQYM